MNVHAQVADLDPSAVFCAFALQSQRRAGPIPGDETSTRPTLVGQSHRTQEVLRLIEKVGKARWPTLIVGEPGTRKEVVARAIHDIGGIGSFVTIDCSSIAGPGIESELFGHVEGAFPGASTAKIGLIERANGGTAFFDGIDALPFDLQVKLLRVLKEKEFRPVGSKTNRRSEFHLIAATTRDLTREVEAETFHRDLFYRVNVVNIRLAPLRERKEDIPTLVSHFLARLGERFALSTQALAVLLLYDWPGNSRELERCIQYMATVCTGEFIDTRDLPPNLQNLLTEIQGTSLSNEKTQSVDASTTQAMNEQIPRSLWAHALDTFGSASLAMEWFLAECGALRNRAPIDIIRDEDGTQEIDRILGCIDYGMIA